MSGTSAWRSFIICAMYGTSSLTLSLLNKAVLSQYKFNFPFILLAAQSGAAWLFISLLRSLRTNGVGKATIPDLPPFHWATFQQSIPLGCCFVGNIAAGFIGLAACSVPMFLVVRRTTTMFVLVTEFVMLSKVPDRNTFLAVTLIVLGAIIAGYETLDSNLVGYLFVIVNNILTAVSLNLQKKFGQSTGCSGMGIVWYTAMTAVPLSLLVAIHQGEVQRLSNFSRMNEPALWVALSISISLGAFISFAIALCATVNSPLATTVTGNVKDLLATFLGWALFGGFEPTTSALTGLFTSFTGAAVYSVHKLRSATARTAAPQIPGATSPPSAGSYDEDEEADSTSERAPLRLRGAA